MRILFYFLSIFVLSLSTQASDNPQIQINAQGTVKVQPDIALFNLSVSRLDLESDKAMNAVEQEVSRLLKLLKKFEVEEGSLDSSQTSLQAEYDYSQNPRVQTGFRANRQVSFRLTDLKQIDQLVTSIAKAGITEINQIQFTVKDTEIYENQALINAITIAKNKAQLIAKTLGVELSKVIKVSHQVNQSSVPVFARAMSMEMDMAKKSSYEQKEIEVTTFIDIIFEVK